MCRHQDDCNPPLATPNWREGWDYRSVHTHTLLGTLRWSGLSWGGKVLPTSHIAKRYVGNGGTPARQTKQSGIRWEAGHGPTGTSRVRSYPHTGRQVFNVCSFEKRTFTQAHTNTQTHKHTHTHTCSCSAIQAHRRIRLLHARN